MNFKSNQIKYNLEKGQIATDELTVFKRFHSLFDIQGCSVVEVGGRIPQKLLTQAEVAHWWSVDPRNPACLTNKILITIRGSASSLPIPDESIDFVFSCNAFQHIHDLKNTFKELARVLKRGGKVYTNFGPIWSAPDGSHIEGLIFEGKEYNFWTHSLIPSWSHLSFNEYELAELLSYLYKEDFGKKIIECVYQTKWINRLFFHDYINLLETSQFEVVFLGVNNEIDYPYNPPCIDTHPLAQRLEQKQLLEYISEKYAIEDFALFIRDLELILRKV
jgi:SAM-dependent methyltransferase